MFIGSLVNVLRCSVKLDLSQWNDRVSVRLFCSLFCVLYKHKHTCCKNISPSKCLQFAKTTKRNSERTKAIYVGERTAVADLNHHKNADTRMSRNRNLFFQARI